MFSLPSVEGQHQWTHLAGPVHEDGTLILGGLLLAVHGGLEYRVHIHTRHGVQVTATNTQPTLTLTGLDAHICPSLVRDWKDIYVPPW